MSKIAFLYPGQGAQVAGMGKDFYEQSPLAKEVFDKSCEILGQDMKHICFEENELLDRTDYTQAALVTTCMAMTKEIMARGLTPDMTAGLSLGEYCAITTAGGMELEDAIKMVWLRGNLMHNAVPDGKGGMAAVLGLSGEAVNEAIAYMEGVYVANYNCPGQIVITGDKEAVANAAPALKEAGAKRVIPLNVSGPFHSIYLKEAGEKLYEALSKVTLGELKIPYVTNVDASIIKDTERTKELLKEQVYSSVLWEQSIRAMIADGVDIFVEIGPGVYEMSSDSRVFQAIEAAGGMREDASGISVNQAQPLCDGQQVYVPTVQEAEERNLTPVVSEIQDGQTGTEMDAGTGLVNLNTADIQTLKTLSGIGDSKAQAILAYREEHGGFSSIEEVMQVPGIKESIFSKIKDKIEVK